MAAVGVRRTTISDLCPGLDNTLIIAVIIGSQSSRTVTVKKDNSQSGVWNFTIRDSDVDFINVTLWGSVSFVNQQSTSFQIGDVVQLTNAKVTFRNAQGENYRPVVSSPYQLTVSENVSEIQHYIHPDGAQFQLLVHIPTKNSLDFITLTNIYSNGNYMKENCVNLLVAVRTVNPVRQIKTQDGRQLECREVVVFDETVTSMILQLWETQMIVQAAFWKPRETVLFLADMRLKWNGFRKSFMPQISSQTIVTVDPRTPEAECLRVYARAALLSDTARVDHLASNYGDVSNIRNVTTTHGVLLRAGSSPEEDQQFTALIYGIITQMDLENEFVILTKCSQCLKPLDKDSSVCLNPDCLVAGGTDVFLPEKDYNIRLNLSDHTGSLKNCRLNGDAARDVLNYSIEEFEEMSADEKVALGWKFLFQRFAVRVLVLKPSNSRRQPVVSILSCTPANLAEVATKLPVF